MEREARQRAIKQASEMVRTSTTPFLRRAPSRAPLVPCESCAGSGGWGPDECPACAGDGYVPEAA